MFQFPLPRHRFRRTPGLLTFILALSTLLLGSLPSQAVGLLSSFAISVPSTATAGSSFSIVVHAKDSGNADIPGYTGTVQFTSTAQSATLPASYTFTGGDMGVHTFSVTLATAGSRTITVTDPGSSVTATSAAITVSAAAAQHFQETGLLASEASGASFNMTFTARDTYGNTDTNFTGTIHFTTAGDATGLPADYTYTGGDAGVHVFPIVLKSLGFQIFTAHEVGTVGFSTLNMGINITANPPSQLIFSAAPGSAVAGTVFNVTLKAADAFGTTVTTYTGTVHFTSSDPSAVLPADYTFINGDAGVHVFPVSLRTAGSRSVTATDTVTSAITGTSSSVTVTTSYPSQFVFTGVPATATAGTPFNMVLTVLDPYGNVATGYTGTVQFASGDPQAVLPSNYAFTNVDAGMHTFAITLKTLGTQTFAANDGPSEIGHASSPITVNAGAATHFVFTGTPGSVSAGMSFHVTVTAKDALGNTDTGYTGTVHFTSSDPQAVLPVDYTFVNGDAGVHVFTVNLKTAGSQAVTATDTVTNSITVTSANIAVSALFPVQFVFSGVPATATAGTPFNILVTLLDPYGNVVTGYTGVVHFTTTGDATGLPADYTFTNVDAGMHTFAITLKTAGTRTVTASDAVHEISNTTSSITVSAGATTQFVFSGVPATAVQGASFPFTLTAKDAFANVTAGYTGTVHFTTVGNGGGMPADYTFTGAGVNKDNGVHIFAATLITAGSQTITATDTISNLLSATSASINVMGLPITGFTLTKPSLVGGKADTAVLTLGVAAPLGGLSVALTSDNAAVPSATLIIPAGATTASVPFPTGRVLATTVVNLTATLNGVPLNAVLTLHRFVQFDFNGDGRADILLQRQPSGEVSVATFIGVAQLGWSILLPSVQPGMQVVGSPDLNNDLNFDLLFQDANTGAVPYVLMDGVLPLYNPATGNHLYNPYLFPFVPAGFKVVGTPDLNGDGHADVLFENAATGDSSYVLLNGTTIVGGNYLFRARNTDYHIVGTPDLDGDGHADIVWQSRSTGKVVYQLMNGVTPKDNGFGVLFASVPAGFLVVGTPDLNGDGHSDFVFQNQASGDVAYVLMNGLIAGRSDYLLRGLPSDYKVVGIH